MAHSISILGTLVRVHGEDNRYTFKEREVSITTSESQIPSVSETTKDYVASALVQMGFKQGDSVRVSCVRGE